MNKFPEKPESVVPPPSPEYTEPSPEKSEQPLDRCLPDLFMYARKINEGNNGIIFHLNAKDLPEPLQEALEQSGVSLEGENVVKVLKVYSKGSGEREFRMQKKTRNILKESGRDDVANVPEPILCHDLKLTPEVTEKLRASGAPLMNRAEVILMDFVPADDIATHLFREIVRRHQKTTHLAPEADTLDFEQLADAVWDAFQFPRRDRRLLREESWEQIRINTQRILTFLYNSDYQMNPQVLYQIRHTMDELHKRGIAFRDAHQRNFLIQGNIRQTEEETAESCRVHLIDFGVAREYEGDLQDAYVEDKGGVLKRYPDDYGIIKFLKPLTRSPKERAQEPTTHAMNEIRQLKIKLEQRSPNWTAFRDAFVAQAQSGSADYDRLYLQTPASPDRLNNFLAAVLDLLTVQPDKRKEITLFLERKAQATYPAERNRIVRFLQSVSSS